MDFEKLNILQEILNNELAHVVSDFFCIFVNLYFLTFSKNFLYFKLS